MAEGSGKTPPLSSPELAVLQLMAWGKTIREMALELKLAPGIVMTHMEHIYEELDATDRAQLVAIALRLGLIT